MWLLWGMVPWRLHRSLLFRTTELFEILMYIILLCTDITEEESRFIKKFFCPVSINLHCIWYFNNKFKLQQKCRQRDPSLTIKYKQKKLEQVGKEESAKKAKKRQEKKESTPKYPHCGECIACYRVDNCNKCESCKGKPRQQCQYRVCLTFAPKVSFVLNFFS